MKKSFICNKLQSWKNYNYIEHTVNILLSYFKYDTPIFYLIKIEEKR